MTASPIGIFDSGVGGLTVMHKIMEILPQESLIYFGDTARLPYGNKSAETIIRYSLEIAEFLAQREIKLLVIACNTASAFALGTLRDRFPFPVVGVIHAGAAAAVAATRNQHIAVLGTKGTIHSGVYQEAITEMLPSARVLGIACPLFVPLVEEQWLSHEAARLIVREYLLPIKKSPVDTVLLGCTHYPLLRELIEEELGEGVTIVDSATTCAREVAALLSESNLLARQGEPSHQYLVSDDPARFHALAEELFPGLKRNRLIPRSEVLVPF